MKTLFFCATHVQGYSLKYLILTFALYGVTLKFLVYLGICLWLDTNVKVVKYA